MSKETELRLHRCCFTGHRPHKLNAPEHIVIQQLRQSILHAISEGYVTFISGMAWGVDIWAAEIVLELKKQFPIHLIAAVPYDGFEKSWDNDWKVRYQQVLSQADLIKYISPHYHKGCFQQRNEWMVNHSSLLIAAYTGEPGGTRNTVEYAKRNGVKIDYCI